MARKTNDVLAVLQNSAVPFGGSIGKDGSLRRSFVVALRIAPVLLFVCALSGQALGQTNEWTWVSGSNTSAAYGGSAGIYGTEGTPAPTNLPGSRNGSGSWTDSSGNLWLFGGAGYDATAYSFGYLNDLWEYNPSTNQWAWMSGSSAFVNLNGYFGQPGVYGTLRTPAAGNIPGSRQSPVSWTDNSGHFWLFGGYAFDENGTVGFPNDLWEYNPSTNQWAWMSGSNTIDQPAVYGTLTTPAAANVPGGRMGSVGWTDSSGNLWLFGGYYQDSNVGVIYLNDLWEFNPTTNEWAWMSGSNTYDQYGIYGTMGTPAATNIPGARNGSVSWTDPSGHLWLFGGQGYDQFANFNNLNDLWEYFPTTNEWAWMSGSNTASSNGSYGTEGVSAAGNAPSSRAGAVSWTDSSGHLWLFGGQGSGGNGNTGWLNDLWEYYPSTNGWAWVGGSSTLANNGAGLSGVYGTMGTPAAANTPGSRNSAVSWTNNSGNLWLFGGYGFDANGDSGNLNDLWSYELPAVTLPVAATPAFNLASGTYTTSQSVTITDSTSGATIYYTTDGSTPTMASSVYSGAIIVSATETVQAIAVASGYTNSAIASATYTINSIGTSEPSYTVTFSPSSLTITAGQSGTTTVTVTPQNGFNSAVSFGCSGLPTGATCSFSPASVTPSGAPATTTLTVSTTAASAGLRYNPLFPAVTLAAGLFCFGFGKRRNKQLLMLFAVCGLGLGLLNGCSGASSSNSGQGTQGTPSTVTVTATSGSGQQTSTFTLTVQQ
jgi:N-acetylneuraminic acid mutarotase